MALTATLLRAADRLTTPVRAEDYLVHLNPLWALREPRARVEAVEPETADAATLWLRPSLEWPAHRPGQYVRVGVDVDGVRHWRTYSLTSTPRRSDGRIAITVRATPDGFVSRRLVHATPAGTVLRLAPPVGDYVLPEPLPRRLAFITAGSGITPVMGMLRALQTRSALRDVVHLHLAPSRGAVIFGRELRALAVAHPGYRLHEHHDDVDGLLDLDAGLGRLGPLGPTWACGPAGLLDGLAEHFEAAGVPEALHVERFAPVVAAPGAAGEGGTVTFATSRRTVEADGVTPLLVAGEQAGALLPSGCRMGICHTCVGRLTAGAVRDLRTGERHEAAGQMVRTCVSVAAGPVEIEL